MTELGPNARSLIELARRGDDPDQAARERVQEALLTRLKAGPAADGARDLGSSAAHGALAAKSGALLAVFAAAVGGGWALYSQQPTALGSAAPASTSLSALTSRPGVAGRLEQPQAAPREGRAAVSSRSSADSSDGSDSNLGMAQAEQANEPSPARASATRARDSKAPSPREAHDASPGRGALGQGLPIARSAGSDASSVEVERSANDAISSPISGAKQATSANEALLAEARALREVQTLLRDGNSTRALMLLAAQERQFASGQLGEARAAARAMAVCTNQSAEGRRSTASAFEARFPRSILLSSVRSACESSEVRSSNGNE
jgi:hypothetical protein